MAATTKELRYALVAIVLWGTLAAVVGDALTGVAAGTLLWWSLLFAAITLSTIHFATGGRARGLVPATGRLTLLGLWGILGYHALFFEALARAPIVEANLLNYLWPLLVVVLAGPLGSEPARKPAWVGAAVGFLGAGLVVTEGRAIGFEARDAVGYACAFLAAFAWSSFSVLLGRGDEKGSLDGDRMTGFVNVSFLAATPLTLGRGELTLLHGHALVAAAWLGIGPMALAFLAWGRAMKGGSAATIGTLSYLDPLLSTLLLALVLHKHLTAATWVGMLLIVGGAALPALAALPDRLRER